MQRRQSSRFVIPVLLCVVCLGTLGAQPLTLPNRPGTLKFAIIGDSGTGSQSQYRVASKLAASRSTFPYEFVLMMGDNLYGGSKDKDFQRKFEAPYKPILDKGIKFYASLGNHDNPNERYYKFFNMSGERYYSFKPRNGIRFFALDSNYMDKPQLQWLETELAASGSDWKIVFFHHPLYSSGGAHGSDLELRGLLEPIFLKYGVDVVLAGHEHFYERIKPQKGIYYFISGGAAKLREGNIGGRSSLTAKGFDTGYHFMLMEIEKNIVHFQTISDQGKTVDSGSLVRFNDQDKKKLSGRTASAARHRPLHRRQRLVIGWKSLEVFLGDDGVANPDGEFAACTLDDLGVDAKLVLDQRRHTGRAGVIVSDLAVSNADVPAVLSHPCVSSFPPHPSGARRVP